MYCFPCYVERSRRIEGESTVKPLTYYHEPASLLNQLKPSAAGGGLPPVRLLDSVWLMDRAEKLAAAQGEGERKALALPHRQTLEQLHPEAFLSVDEVCGLECDPEAANLGIAIGAISHAWTSPAHPDPDGSQLLRVAALLRAAQAGELQRQRPGAVPGPFGPTNYKRLPARVGLFYDFCSLFQATKDSHGEVLKARSPPEQAAFRAALSEMQLWYAHKLVFAILVTAPPAGAALGSWLPYEGRGWPTVERAWTVLAKTNAVACWPMVYDVSSGSGEADRPPPLHPDSLSHLLDEKTFSSGKADRALVETLYRDTLLSVLGGAEVLSFARSGWTDKDFIGFADVLPVLKRCKRLELHENACGDAGASALATAVTAGALPLIETIFLEENCVGDAGCQALAAALEAGGMPNLKRLQIAQNPASDDAKDVLQNALSQTCAKREGSRRTPVRRNMLTHMVTHGRARYAYGLRNGK